MMSGETFTSLDVLYRRAAHLYGLQLRLNKAEGGVVRKGRMLVTMEMGETNRIKVTSRSIRAMETFSSRETTVENGISTMETRTSLEKEEKELFLQEVPKESS